MARCNSSSRAASRILRTAGEVVRSGIDQARFHPTHCSDRARYPLMQFRISTRLEPIRFLTGTFPAVKAGVLEDLIDHYLARFLGDVVVGLFPHAASPEAALADLAHVPPEPPRRPRLRGLPTFVERRSRTRPSLPVGFGQRQHSFGSPAAGFSASSSAATHQVRKEKLQWERILARRSRSASKGRRRG